MLTKAIKRQQANVWQDDPNWVIIGPGEGADEDITRGNLDEFLYPREDNRAI